MPIPEMFHALVADWGRVDGLLDDHHRARLRDLVLRLTDTTDRAERELIRAEVARVLFDGLPPDDPVVVVGNRLDLGLSWSESVVLGAATVSLRRLLHRDVPWSARSRILTEAWVTAVDLRKQGIDPDVPGLIRLAQDDGSVAVPLFQLAPDGHPVDLVVRVNEVLGADDDPWGAADWWLSANAWLHRPPADLLAAGESKRIMAAALAVVGG